MSNAHALIVGIAEYPNIAPACPTPFLPTPTTSSRRLTDPNLCAYPPEQGLAPARRRGDVAEACGLNWRTRVAGRPGFHRLHLHLEPRRPDRVRAGGRGVPSALRRDARPRRGAPADQADTAMSGAEFAEAMDRIPARKLLVVFDCCHAGGLGATKDATAPGHQGGPLGGLLRPVGGRAGPGHPCVVPRQRVLLRAARRLEQPVHVSPAQRASRACALARRVDPHLRPLRLPAAEGRGRPIEPTPHLSGRGRGQLPRRAVGRRQGGARPRRPQSPPTASPTTSSSATPNKIPTRRGPARRCCPGWSRRG